MPAWLAPALTFAGSALTSALSVREAAKNRQFQERMSNTAHQREMADLRASNLNPLLGLRSSGASSPSGSTGQISDLGGAVASGMALKRQQAEIDLLRAQEWKTRTETMDIQQAWEAGKWDVIKNQVEAGRISNEQARAVMPTLIEQAKADVQATLASARGANAMALLNELAKAGALNESKWNELIGLMGPAGRTLKSVAGVAIGGARGVVPFLPRTGASISTSMRIPGGVERTVSSVSKIGKGGH